MDTSLQVARSTSEVIGRDPTGGFNNSDFRTRIDQITWQNHLDWRSLSLLAGLNFHWDKGSSGSSRLNSTIIQRAGFAALSWDGGWVDLSASVRNDRNSTSSNKTTYHGGIVLHPMDGVRLTSNYGTGFKPPSINDLYFPKSSFSGGNSNLIPETSKGWDMGIHYQANVRGVRGGLKSSVPGLRHCRGMEAGWI